MDQIRSVWTAMDNRKRVIVGLATVAMFAAILGVARIAATPSMALLYSGLDAQAAGDVVAALDQQSAKYEVRGTSIYVEGSQRDALRMTLASEGLPANSTAGYEILDSLSGFGTTSQMFDAAYWRAKEGELSRTIVSSPLISAARVHISSAGGQPFRQAVDPSASVTITPTAGAISAEHARALRNLVASAVGGLIPENVSIINGQNGRIIGADAQNTGANDRADQLKTAVERILIAHVGPGNAVVEVSVETETERQAIVERIIDPDSRVAISTDTEESTTQAEDSRNTQASVASNLPDGDAATDGSSSTSRNNLTRERVNFEVSETQREILREPGAIRRVSVAVLVDGVEQTGDGGITQIVPRDREELEVLRGLVASAVGFDEARGDTITIESLPFEPIIAEGTSSVPGAFTNLDITSIIQIAVLSVVALLLGLFVVRPVLTSSPVPALSSPDINSTELPDGLIGEISEAPTETAVAMLGNSQDQPTDAPDPVNRLRELISERQSETVEILRSWMEESEEQT